MKNILYAISLCFIICHVAAVKSFELNTTCFGQSQNQYQFIDKNIQESKFDNVLGIAKGAKLVLYNTPIGIYEVDLTDKLNEYEFPSEEQFLAAMSLADESTQKDFLPIIVLRDI